MLNGGEREVINIVLFTTKIATAEYRQAPATATLSGGQPGGRHLCNNQISLPESAA